MINHTSLRSGQIEYLSINETFEKLKEKRKVRIYGCNNSPININNSANDNNNNNNNNGNIRNNEVYKM